MAYEHVPVLLDEVIKYLEPRAGQNFIDATLGGGGYSEAILRQTGPNGRLLAIDLDNDAIANFQQQAKQLQNRISHLSGRLILHHGNFAQIDKITAHHGFPPPDGIVADLGLSSYELNQAGRGLSFQGHEILDMRFDQDSRQPDAKFILAHYDQKELTRIFKDYGEEKFAFAIARKIAQARQQGREFKYTDELYELIAGALPKPVRHRAADSARRVFQALRIEVNRELDSLADFLPKAFDLLAPGGRLAAVSFHSLEDRLVKRFFAGLTKGCVCPPDFPQCLCGKSPRGRLAFKKPVTASAAELDRNSRAKPAKLRVIIKV